MTEQLMNAFLVTGSEWVLWLLFALSIASVGVMVERAMFLWRRRINVESVTLRLAILLDKGETEEAIALLSGVSMEASVSRSVLSRIGRPADALEDLYRAEVERARLSYERGISFLATLGSNAPFIGLFGTVLGIIAAFADLQSAAQGQNRAQVIMGSISEALIATAVGLLVAIPAVVAYNLIQRRVERSVGATEVLVRQVLARIRGV